MVILSIDYGDKRTGIAVCDKSELLARPVCVIEQDGFNKLLAEIIDIAFKEKAKLIVVGNPINMNSSRGERSEKCKSFAKRLESESGIETVLWDERLTTVSAHGILNENNVRGKRRKDIVDAVAATIILEDYLSFRRNSV